MAEYVANALQTVESNQNVLFRDAFVSRNTTITHRTGSGIITLRGLTNQYRAKFQITFGANIAIPEGGTVEPISIAIAIEGEAVPYSEMIVTPTVAEAFWNVNRSIYIDIPCGCCVQIGIKNTSDQAIDVQNANLIIDRVA